MRRMRRTHETHAHALRMRRRICVLTKPTVCMRRAQRPHYRTQLLSPLRSLPLQVKKKIQVIKKKKES
jgi:hypothetical protein